MSDVRRAEGPFVLSSGEIDFLWWFIQGSIMDPVVRARLYAHWGLCERHSLAFLVVESSFRPHLIHGSTILYNELMRRAAEILNGRGLLSLAPTTVSRHLLRPSGPCHICDLGYNAASSGNVAADRLAQGRDVTNAIRFAAESQRGWFPYVCGLCAGTQSPVLCRPHLVEAMEHDGTRAARAQHDTVCAISSHLARFETSFRWEKRNTDTDEDRGALIGAIGWCSGWSELLRLLPDCAGLEDHEDAQHS